MREERNQMKTFHSELVQGAYLCFNGRSAVTKSVAHRHLQAARAHLCFNLISKAGRPVVQG